MLGGFVTTSELALVVLSAFLHAIWSASIKGSRNPLGFNLLQLAPPVAAACLLPLWVPLGDVPRAVWWIAIGTGVSHGFYFYWLARALASGELSIVYPIARSAPAFLPLFAVLLLGESLSIRGALGIAVVVAGMWAVQADAGVVGWQRFRAPGAKFAWLTLLASIGYSLCDKAAMTRLNVAPWHSAIPPAVVYYMLLSVAGGVVFTPLALRHVPRAELAAVARSEWRNAFLAAAVSFASYGLILQALRSAPVSYVVAARQTSVLFAVAIGALRWRERPSRLRLLGALATVLGVALVAG
ncbi:MAG: EamA family transporter [Deltaproteobacteria bacterium]|nr:EamA family transporter [Deltaproteobacteria bacterium]